jgi:hypothetical protein
MCVRKSLDHWWNDIDRERWSTRIKTRISATLFTTIATWTDLGSNAGILGENSANDRQSHGAATERIVAGAICKEFVPHSIRFPYRMQSQPLNPVQGNSRRLF